MAQRQTFARDLEAIPAYFQGLTRGLETITTLEQLFAWIREGGDRFGSIDLLAQDEFSHDLVLECFMNQGKEKRRVFLVFGST